MMKAEINSKVQWQIFAILAIICFAVFCGLGQYVTKEMIRTKDFVKTTAYKADRFRDYNVSDASYVIYYDYEYTVEDATYHVNRSYNYGRLIMEK